MNGKNRWLPEWYAKLRILWDDPHRYSQTEIAGWMTLEFGVPFTKNMIVGQANRLKLIPRPSNKAARTGGRASARRAPLAQHDLLTARKLALQLPRDAVRVMDLIRARALAGKPAPNNTDICSLVGALSTSTAARYRRRLAEVQLIRIEDVSSSAIIIHAGPLEIETRKVAWSTANPLGSRHDADADAVAREDHAGTALLVVPPAQEGPDAEPLIPERVWRTPLVRLPTTRPAGVRFRECQWPEGEPRAEGFRLCADPTVEPGKPYCLAHCMQAYVPSRPRGAAA